MSLLSNYSLLINRNNWTLRQCESALAREENECKQLSQRLEQTLARSHSLSLIYQSLTPGGVITRSILFTQQRKQAAIKARLAETQAMEQSLRQDMQQVSERIEALKRNRQQLVRKDKKLEYGFQRVRRQRYLKRQLTEDNEVEEIINAYQS